MMTYVTTVTNNVGWPAVPNQAASISVANSNGVFNQVTVQDAIDITIQEMKDALRDVLLAWDLKGCDCELSDCRACELVEWARDAIESNEWTKEILDENS